MYRLTAYCDLNNTFSPRGSFATRNTTYSVNRVKFYSGFINGIFCDSWILGAGLLEVVITYDQWQPVKLLR